VDVAVGGAQAAEVNAWYAGADIARRLTRAFLRWAMHNKLLARVTIQHKDIRNPTPLSQRHRFVLIRQLLTDEDIPM
jgi:hypothetical protein